MRVYSRLHEALLSKLTSWHMIPLTCRHLHSLHVTMDWMWEVRFFFFLLLPLLLSLRNLKQIEVLLFQNLIGKQSVKKCGWQQSANLARGVWQGPQLLTQVIPGPGWSEASCGEAAGMQRTQCTDIYIFFFNLICTLLLHESCLTQVLRALRKTVLDLFLGFGCVGGGVWVVMFVVVCFFF